MDQQTLITTFSAYCGRERFRKFLLALNTACRHKRRLVFWQEELWQRFTADYPGEVPVAFDDIAEAFRLCPLHGILLKEGEVPVLYGYVVSEPACNKARKERFPFAKEVVLGGCCVELEKSVRTDYCEACREEYQSWVQKRKRKGSRSSD